MTWGTIRRANEIDEQRMDALQARFVKRHRGEIARCIGLNEHGLDDDSPADVLSHMLFYHGRGEADLERVRQLYQAGVRRALGSDRATGIAYGMVGYDAD